MSRSNRDLRIDSDDPTADIKVLDVGANTVAHGIGRLDATLPEGIYKVRVRVGPEFQERMVVLDESAKPLWFPRLQFASPIPVDNTSRSHEYHQGAVKWAWDHPAPALGSGSRLLISAREWSPDGSLAHPHPAAGLSLILPSGKSVAFGDFAEVRHEGDACAIGVVDVDPGFYRVELKLPDGTRLRRALHASPGWPVQLYMLFQEAGGARVPNLAGGSVAIAQAPVVHDDQTRLAEIALDALTQHRAILDGHMRSLLSDKFQQPFLGLLGAHLLLRDREGGSLFRTVVDNLTYLLGPDHPDVGALRTRLGEAAAKPVTEPPMLRASWDLVVEASATHPGLVPPDSPAARAAEFAVPSDPWLVWQPPADEADSGRADAKLEVLRAYLQAQAQSRRPPPEGVVVMNEPEAAPQLDEASRADLSRALGVPSLTLDSLLKRL